MRNKLIKVLKVFFGFSGIVIILIFSLFFYKANSIYNEAWSKETFNSLDWNEYSKDFKTVALSELDYKNVHVAISRLTLKKYFNERSIRQLEWHFWGFITFSYCKVFVSYAEALPKVLKDSYLGSNLTGFSKGADYYFNKSIKDIDLSESALLFAIWIAPGKFNPLKNIDNAYKGRTIVLERLRKNGVSSDIISKAYAQPISLASRMR